MKILVLGGTQFVSKSLSKYLVEKEHDVSIFTRGNLHNRIEGISRHYIGNRKCKRDLEQLKKQKFDVIFDMSGYVLEDVKNLFEVLEINSISKYIFCSSGAVYEPSDNLLKESSPCGENENWGKYGTDKALIENYLLEFNEKYKLPVSIVRPTYIYGKGNNLYREAYFFDRILQNKAIPIPSGNKVVQFIYIDDLINILYELMFSSKAIGQIYNVTHEQTISWEKLVSTAIQVVGKTVEVKSVNDYANLKTREFFPFRDINYLLDISKLKEDGLPVPVTNLKDGLTLSYEWYSQANIVFSDKKMRKIDFALSL